MTDDPRNKRPNAPQKKKNPTLGISVFIVVVLLLVIFTLLFNAIREKREFDEQTAPPATASGARPALPAIGASQ
ncbi:hypothetical protein [Caballeronia grimmiae]|jgi:hypothetical protein|uniref:Signal peptide protein n=1 Tax=Caballeronia grimmiae TaxID=1071679 RepID=A0A069P7N6_9BURK|nr:hypothetical protein [Caballeronia grimmiae]KDR36608.1 signal peptide protein [Caballeronia grimmiae]GGD54507.1 hypothetical protein GCM10010985_05400 [Caballeronia grimmiae]